MSSGMNGASSASWLELLLAVRFEHPWVLWLLVPGLASGLAFASSQLRAVHWIHERVDPRFRSHLTRHGPASLKLHLLFLALLGLCLLAAAAGPTVPGGVEITAESDHVILLLDASASMKASDVASGEGPNAPKITRFERAREVARELVDALPEAHFALVSWSGTAALHLPLVDDRGLLHEALRVVESHDFYSNTGSSFTAALDTALSLTDLDRSTRDEAGDREPIPIVPQVVLLSDGEIPRLEDGREPPNADYSDALAALAARRIPVHGVAVGSDAGQARLIFDFRDVLAKKPAEERRVLRRYTTRREVRHLTRMAQETCGSFVAVEDGQPAAAVAARVAEAITESPAKAAWLERSTARSPVGHVPLAVFLAAFLLDALWIGQGIGRGPRPEDGAFELERLGEPHRNTAGASSRPATRGLLLALAALLATIPACRGADSGAEAPAQRAHRENEKGIQQDRLGLHRLARSFFERSRSYGVRAQVPTHNLALSFAREEQWSEAHRHFQAALELDPSLAEAYYHDGVTLFRWGHAELDPHACHPERTLDLWSHARDRFATTLDRAEPESELTQRADADYAHVDDLLERLQELKENPPPECRESQGGAGGPPENEEDASDGDSGGGSPSQGGGPSEGGGGAEGASEGGGAGGAPPHPPAGSQDPEPARAPQPGADPGGGGQPEPGQDPGAGIPARDEPPPTEPDPSGGQGPQGQSESDPDGNGRDGGGADGGDPSPQGPSPEERQQIARALERIRQELLETGKYHRRTREEQFPKSSWSNPESIIWW